MRRYERGHLNIDSRRKRKFLLVCLLGALCILTVSGCRKSDKTVSKTDDKETVLVVSPEEETDAGEETDFFNRANEKTKVSNAKELGGSKTLDVIESEQKDYTENEEPEQVTTWIPGIW